MFGREQARNTLRDHRLKVYALLVGKQRILPLAVKSAEQYSGSPHSKFERSAHTSFITP